MVSGSVRRLGRDLRADQAGILQPDLTDDHDPLLALSRRGKCGRSELSIWATAITSFIMLLCSAPSMLLRWRFDRAFRAAFGH